MKTDIIVLGAGIVGVSTALHLQDRGRAVVLVDRGAPGSGTSYGNAGLIERASVVPYAFPRSLGSLAKYALNRSSDVRYDPLYLPRIAGWLFQYWRHSSPARLEAATRALLPLIEASVAEHDLLIARANAAHLIRSDGWISFYKSDARLAQALAETQSLSRFGLKIRTLTASDFLALEPSFSAGIERVAGGIHWLDPKTVTDPQGLTSAYADLFAREGGTFLNADATGLSEGAEGWSLRTVDGDTLHAREVVVALGPQSGLVFRKAAYNLPLGIKRGYHRHYRPVDDAPALRHSVVDEEAGYVLAPMRQGIRLTTGIEFADPAAPPNMIQLGRDEIFARRLFPLGKPVEKTPWLGLRPCLPDMKPVIGRAWRHKGLWFNFGHAHHGLTLGPACGRLLADEICGTPAFADPGPFDPQRFR